MPKYVIEYNSGRVQLTDIKAKDKEQFLKDAKAMRENGNIKLVRGARREDIEAHERGEL